MKRLEKTISEPQGTRSVHYNIPDQVCVHEDDAPYASHHVEIHMADARAPIPNTPYFSFPLAMDHDGKPVGRRADERVQGYLTVGLPDPARRALFLELLTEIRDNLASDAGYAESTYAEPQALTEAKERAAAEKEAERLRAEAKDAADRARALEVE